MGIKIGVAADDVTGANDTGSTFGNGGFRSAVFPLGLTEGRNMEEEARGLDRSEERRVGKECRL